MKAFIPLVLVHLFFLPAVGHTQSDWDTVKSEIEAIRVQHNLPSIGYSLLNASKRSGKASERVT